MALNKVGELQHMQGDVAAAAGLYEQALRLRRALLAATRQQWQAHAAPGEQAAAPAAAAASAPGAEGGEACCSAALDLAASYIKLAGARRELGAGGGGTNLFWKSCPVLLRRGPEERVVDLTIRLIAAGQKHGQRVRASRHALALDQPFRPRHAN